MGSFVVEFAYNLVQLISVSDTMQDRQPMTVPHGDSHHFLGCHLLCEHLLRSAYRDDCRPYLCHAFPLARFSAVFISVFEKLQNFHPAVKSANIHQNASRLYANSIRRTRSSVSLMSTPDLSFATCRSSYKVAVTMSIA